MKKLLIYLSVIIAIFALIFTVKELNKPSDSTDNPYGIPQSKLQVETRQLLKDPNYQNIILPDELHAELQKGGDLFVYFFSADCIHCRRTTPVIMPVAKELGVDLKQFNLLEFRNEVSTYRIESWPVIIHFKDGQMFDRLSGGISDKAQDSGGYHGLDTFKKFISGDGM